MERMDGCYNEMDITISSPLACRICLDITMSSPLGCRMHLAFVGAMNQGSLLAIICCDCQNFGLLDIS